MTNSHSSVSLGVVAAILAALVGLLARRNFVAAATAIVILAAVNRRFGHHPFGYRLHGFGAGHHRHDTRPGHA